LAKSKSKEPSAAQTGGDLGYFTKAEMVPQFADAAFAMKVGEVSSEPIKSPFGYHIIKVEDRRLKAMPSYDEVKPAIRDHLVKEAVQQVVIEMRGKAKIKRNNPDGTPMADQPAPAPAQN